MGVEVNIVRGERNGGESTLRDEVYMYSRMGVIRVIFRVIFVELNDELRFLGGETTTIPPNDVEIIRGIYTRWGLNIRVIAIRMTIAAAVEIAAISLIYIIVTIDIGVAVIYMMIWEATIHTDDVASINVDGHFCCPPGPYPALGALAVEEDLKEAA